jgi:hypothetical protein
MSIYGTDYCPVHAHVFDRISGWCSYVGSTPKGQTVTCGCRDDGRLVGKGGQVIHAGPSYRADELAIFRERADA